MPGEYTEFIRATLTTATGTYNTVELKLPTVQMPQLMGSYGRGAGALRGNALALILHAVEVTIDSAQAAGADHKLQWQLTKNVQTAIVGADNPNLIQDGGYLIVFDASGSQMINLNEKKTFYPPLMLSESSLHFGALQGSGGTIYFRIKLHYTLRQVNLAEFVNAQLPKN